MSELYDPDKILQSLDGISKAAAPDFFQARLRARMQRELTASPKQPFFLLKPAFLSACLLLFLMLNLVTINRIQPGNKHNQPNTEAGMESFANNYELSANSFYE